MFQLRRQSEVEVDVLQAEMMQLNMERVTEAKSQQLVTLQKQSKLSHMPPAAAATLLSHRQLHQQHQGQLTQSHTHHVTFLKPVSADTSTTASTSFSS